MKNLNLNYGSLMSSFDVVVASLAAYSTVFLIANGLDEFTIGIVISVGNLLTSVFSPWLGDKVDKSIKLNLYHVNLMIVIPSIVLLIGILLSQRVVLIMTIMYMAALTLQATLSPFMNGIGVLLMNNGYKLNFGACRGAESATFAVTSSILGILINNFGTNMIIVVAIIGYLLYLVMLKRLHNIVLAGVLEKHSNDVKMNIVDIALEKSQTAFFKKYPAFILVLLGALCFFIGHNFINLFMIQIITNVGGNTGNMGFAIALAAIVEVPVMVFFTRINRRFQTHHIMMTAGIVFLVKTILTYMAANVTGVYLAQLLQAFAFGIYIVAVVYYTNEMMQSTDKVKGQALITTAHTLGAVIGSSVGGWLINQFSVNAGLSFGIATSVFGVICFYFGLIHPTRKSKIVVK